MPGLDAWLRALKSGYDKLYKAWELGNGVYLTKAEVEQVARYLPDIYDFEELKDCDDASTIS